MGSQPSYSFLGMDTSSLSLSSLALIRALVICSVKAMFSVLLWGSLAILCRKPITSGRVQLSKSRSLPLIQVVVSSSTFDLLSIIRVLTSSQVRGCLGKASNQRLGSFPWRPCHGHNSPL